MRRAVTQYDKNVQGVVAPQQYHRVDTHACLDAAIRRMEQAISAPQQESGMRHEVFCLHSTSS